MSFNSSNYMDGVPVKISEKFKPPPKVSIPQAVLNRLSNITKDHYESSQYTYSFQLEKQVIKKLAEWQKVRETERENRRERIRKYELQKCRDIEEKQKQLLTAVSYPSAEDLSSDDEEEDRIEAVKQEVALPKVDGSSRHPQQSFDTILQPIVANSFNSYSAHSPSTVFNPSKINYSDFENDTSSPFDNIELKTINDLDILAQVLNDTQRHSVENSLEAAKIVGQNADAIEEGRSELAAEPPQLSQKSPPAVEVEMTAPNQNLTSNFYYTTDAIPNSYQMMVHQSHALHLHQQQQNQPYMLNYSNINHHNMEPSAANVYFNYNGMQAANNQNYWDYGQQPEGINKGNTKYDYPNGTYVNNYCDSEYGMHSVGVVADGKRLEPEIIPKSKSKSVPDILKELKDEIRDSEIRRTRNHSQTVDNPTKRNSADSAQSFSSPVPTSRSSSSSSTIFMKLSPSSQTLAKNISSMGFPLERVSKIAELYGNDDKKIVEHLIPLSELLDLGFDESKISEALVKFDNNKDKALDFLIS